jgi:hypothetical protein
MYRDPIVLVAGIKGGVPRDECPVEPETGHSVLRAVVTALDRTTPHPYNTRYGADGEVEFLRTIVSEREAEKDEAVKHF